MWRSTLSLLCPSRGRPAGLRTLIESVAATASLKQRVEILVYIDADDPNMAGYQETFDALRNAGLGLGRLEGIVGPPQSVSISWNLLASACGGDILMMANDDQVYVQSGWDERLDQATADYPDGIYCMWFDDGINAGRHCAFPIVSRRWYESLDYFTPGVFEFIANDTWMSAARWGDCITLATFWWNTGISALASQNSTRLTAAIAKTSRNSALPGICLFWSAPKPFGSEMRGDCGR